MHPTIKLSETTIASKFVPTFYLICKSEMFPIKLITNNKSSFLYFAIFDSFNW